jgi:hypothetical protein
MTVEKARSPLLAVALALLGAAAGVIATLLFTSRPSVPPPAPAAAATPAPAAPATAGHAPAREPAPAQLAEALNTLAEAITNPDRDARGEALRHLAAKLVAEDVNRALEVGNRIPDANDKMEFMRALFGAWAAREPQAALDYLKAKFKPGLLQSESISAAMEKWAEKNPRDAWQWIDANLAGPLKEQAINSLVQSWTRNDPQAAAAWFVSAGSTSQSTLNSLVSSWADINPRAAAAWVETLTNSENKAIGRVSLASEWAQQSPADAAEYFAPMLAEKGGQDIGTALISSWGAADPAAASEWIQKLPASPAREEAAGSLATIWAASDINAAVKWSETITDPTIKPGIIDHLGTTWGAIEPQKALAWLATLPDDETRSEATRGALDSWAGTDPKGMEAWLAQQPAGPTADQARVSLGAVYSDDNPQTSVQTALAISNPTMRGDAVAKFFRHWRKADDASAQQWLADQWQTLTPELQRRLANEQTRRLPPK